MAKLTKITLSRKSAEELADIEIKLGVEKPEQKEELVKKHMIPQKAWFLDDRRYCKNCGQLLIRNDIGMWIHKHNKSSFCCIDMAEPDN